MLTMDTDGVGQQDLNYRSSFIGVSPVQFRHHKTAPLGENSRILNLNMMEDMTDKIREDLLNALADLGMKFIEEKNFGTCHQDHRAYVTTFLLPEYQEILKQKTLDKFYQFLTSIPEHKKVQQEGISAEENQYRYIKSIAKNEPYNPTEPVKPLDTLIKTILSDITGTSVWNEKTLVELLNRDNEFFFYCIDKYIDFNPLSFGQEMVSTIDDQGNEKKEDRVFFHPELYKVMKSLTFNEPDSEPEVIGKTDTGMPIIKMQNTICSTYPEYVDLHISLFSEAGDNYLLYESMRDRYLANKNVQSASTHVHDTTVNADELKTEQKKGSSGLKKTKGSKSQNPETADVSQD